MSVQLSLYPQNFDGTFSSFTVQPNNLLNDCINWTTIDSVAGSNAYINSGFMMPLLQFPMDAKTHFNGFGGGGLLAPGAWKAFGESSTNVLESFGIPTNYLQFGQPVGEVAGCMQRVTLLTPGASYTFSCSDIYVDGANPFQLKLEVFDIGTNATVPLTGGVNTVYLPGNAYEPSIEYQFTAPVSGNDIGVMIFGQSGGSTIIIDDAALNLTADFTSGAIELLESGQVIVDLYEDESIPLTFSVDNFKNAAEKTQSYSKAFKLPGTRRNNQIFDNLYEITRSINKTIQFNPHIKTKASLKENGFLIFEGYLRVIDVQDKEGEISYNVNLYSTPVALADVLKNRTFADLDLDELEHNYNKTQIQYSWNDAGTPITWENANTSGFRTDFKTVKYPFCDWNHQFLVATGAGSPTANMPQLNCLQDAFRPWISLKYLIDRIFADSPFEYSCAIWESTDFSNLYMDFNWGADVDIPTFNEFGYVQNAANNEWPPYPYPIGTSFQKTGPADHSPGFATKAKNTPTMLGHTWTTGSAGYSEFTATYDGQTFMFWFEFKTMSKSTAGGFPFGTAYNHICQFQWIHEPSGGTPAPIPGTFYETDNGTGDGVLEGIYAGTFHTTTLGIIVGAGDKFYCEVKYVSKVNGTPSMNFANIIAWTTINKTVNSSLLGALRGDLNQWDFIKGLMTMYNLLAIPDEDNPSIITFRTYDELYGNEGDGTSLKERKIEHDWTYKVDATQIKLTPLEIKDQTTLQYEVDDDDYAFANYRDSVEDHLYGSKKYISGYGNLSLLTGENKIEAKPFAATIMKPLMSQYHTLIVPTMYSMGDDGKTDGFENAPRICYNNGIYDMTGDGYSYYIPAQNGAFSSNQPEYLRFSHLSELPIDFVNNDTRDVNFGMCQFAGISPAFATPVTDNLYNLYWARYLHELYHPDTREMTLKVNLSPADIEMFKFNHEVYIKNRRFRVNKIDYKPNDLSTVEFILIPE